MRAALAIALIFAARFAVGAWFDPGRDGDIAWQQWLGLHIVRTGHLPGALGPEAFAASGAPWVPQEWALSLLVAWTLGTPLFAGLVALTTAAASAVLAFTALAARRLGASTIAAALAAAFTGEAMLESYGIRAQVFAWAALAAFLYVLRCAPQRRRWWIVPIAALWANVHASAMLAPALLLLWTAGVAIEERGWSLRVRRYALLTLAASAAVFATPLGYRLPIYALTLLHSPIRAAINEWQPSTLAAPSFTFGALPLMLLGAWLLCLRPRRSWPEILMCAAAAWLALSAVRNVPVCAIVLAPVVAQRLTAYLPERLRLNTVFYDRALVSMFFAGTAAAAALVAFALVASPQFSKHDLPERAIAALASQHGTYRLYCEDFAWCSLALAHPNLREFLDGRCDPFPLAVWQDYVTIFHAKGAWRGVLDRRGINAVLVDKSRALARALPLAKDWRVLYSGRTYRLFVRVRPREAAGEPGYHPPSQKPRDRQRGAEYGKNVEAQEAA